MHNKNKTTKENYDKLYSKEENVFGAKPIGIVEKIPDYISGGRVLDIGAGDGRNSIFLASMGYDVRALDFSEEAVRKLREKANKLGLDNLSVRIFDATEDDIEGSYSVIISSFLFHHIKKESIQRLIHEMQEHTNQEGVNVITAFTKEGDFFKLPKSKKFFYPKMGELRNIYKSWKILQYEEKETLARQKNDKGEHMKNITSFLIARKK